MYVKSAKDLEVYKLAYEQAMEVFTLSKDFPKEEKYSLTDQLRRASRSVCGNLREAWAKRRYIAHFASKLTDCDGENLKRRHGLILHTTVIIYKTKYLYRNDQKKPSYWADVRIYDQ